MRNELPNACTLLALRAYNYLPAPPLVPWKRILVVNFGSHSHVLLLFETFGRIYYYDHDGSAVVGAPTRHPLRIARRIYKRTSRVVSAHFLTHGNAPYKLPRLRKAE